MADMPTPIERQIIARFVMDYAHALHEAGFTALANVLQPNLEPSIVWELYEEMQNHGVAVPMPSLAAFEVSPPGRQDA